MNISELFNNIQASENGIEGVIHNLCTYIKRKKEQKRLLGIDDDSRYTKLLENDIGPEYDLICSMYFHISSYIDGDRVECVYNGESGFIKGNNRIIPGFIYDFNYAGLHSLEIVDLGIYVDKGTFIKCADIDALIAYDSIIMTSFSECRANKIIINHGSIDRKINYMRLRGINSIVSLTDKRTVCGSDTSGILEVYEDIRDGIIYISYGIMLSELLGMIESEECINEIKSIVNESYERSENDCEFYLDVNVKGVIMFCSSVYKTGCCEVKGISDKNYERIAYLMQQYIHSKNDTIQEYTYN